MTFFDKQIYNIILQEKMVVEIPFSHIACVHSFHSKGYYCHWDGDDLS